MTLYEWVQPGETVYVIFAVPASYGKPLLMPEKIELRIDSPCTESWDGMEPNQAGRHCLSCQKTVVDLTLMSDQEILDWLAIRHGSVCGRLREGQLNRELVAR